MATTAKRPRKTRKFIPQGVIDLSLLENHLEALTDNEKARADLADQLCTEVEAANKNLLQVPDAHDYQVSLLDVAQLFSILFKAVQELRHTQRSQYLVLLDLMQQVRAHQRAS